MRKIHFLGNDEKLLIELGDISKKAGINSKYKANFTDKSLTESPPNS